MFKYAPIITIIQSDLSACEGRDSEEFNKLLKLTPLVSGEVGRYLNRKMSSSKPMFFGLLSKRNGRAKLQMKVDHLFGVTSIPPKATSGNEDVMVHLAQTVKSFIYFFISF